jgi:hypothetical protein
MILPRLIRFRDAPAYLGMDRNRFNAEVRPKLREVPIGVQGIAFDRLDLDAWADDYVNRNGRAPVTKGVITWGTEGCQDSGLSMASGMSESASEAMANFAKALNRVNTKKQSGT